MPFVYRWFNDEKTAVVLAAEGDWNWQDYHRVARVAAMNTLSLKHAVDTVVDLRGSTRARFPAGPLGHVRTFGKPISPALTGRAVVIGLPDAIRAEIAPDGELETPHGVVVFVATDDEIKQILADWRETTNKS